MHTCCSTDVIILTSRRDALQIWFNISTSERWSVNSARICLRMVGIRGAIAPILGPHTTTAHRSPWERQWSSVAFHLTSRLTVVAAETIKIIMDSWDRRSTVYCRSLSLSLFFQLVPCCCRGASILSQIRWNVEHSAQMHELIIN